MRPGEPITDVFDLPIHHQPVTAFGKLVMARVGPVQGLALATAMLLLAASIVCPAPARRSVLRVTRVALGVSMVLLGLEVLVVLGWAVTLWSWSNGAAAALAGANVNDAVSRTYVHGRPSPGTLHAAYPHAVRERRGRAMIEVIAVLLGAHGACGGGRLLRQWRVVRRR